jgi:hypothetical protein
MQIAAIVVKQAKAWLRQPTKEKELSCKGRMGSGSALTYSLVL